MRSDVPLTRSLPSGDIPSVGLGTYKLQGDVAEQSVATALGAGYDHIDTAEIYGNQPDIGRVIQEYDRDDLFITSKTWRNHFSHEEVLTSTDQTLQELQTDYLDLLLIHWPDENADYEAMLRALKKLVDAGTVKNVGVSNFTVSHLKTFLPLAEQVGVDIAVNQVEFHPLLYQDDLLSFCQTHGVQLEAYAPLATGRVAESHVLQDIGERHGKTAFHVALRWALQHGAVVIPRSTDPDHIRSNIDVFDFELSSDEVKRINAIDQHERMYNPPFAEF